MGVLNASTEKTKLLKNVKESQSPEKQKYPKAIFFIIGNEFCERFTYYGLRTVLTIYLTQRLYYSENTATVIYHLFTMLAYFTPLLGAIIADSWLGKFQTILYLSILYACGGIILSLGAFPYELDTMKAVSLVGLFVIGLGTGGIKPCVSAFGGDQFKAGQESQLQKFFSIFYLSINLGSLFSTFLTPILREEIHCFGENSCFSVAFGVPSILMIVALLLFICGKPLYKIRPPEGNIVLKVTKCICYAIHRKCKTSEKKKSHWLDYADDKFEKNLIKDIKILLNVLVLYIPLPIFWALFDQQGSRWTLQATRMDGKVNGYHIKADQMQVINPLLIIVFIPLFDYVIYPALQKCNLLKTSLQRITTGGVLAAISFVVAGFIELTLESSYPVLPSSGYSQLTIINNMPCSVRIDGVNISSIPEFDNTVVNLPLEQLNVWTFNPEDCGAITEPYEYSFNSSSSIESMMITFQNGQLTAMKTQDTKAKTKDGEPKVRLFYSMDLLDDLPKNITFLMKDEEGTQYIISAQQENGSGISGYYKVPPGRYKIYAPFNKTAYLESPIGAEHHFKSGGVYIVYAFDSADEKLKVSSEYEMVMGNHITILLQIPQYIIITAGEIMFSITGLEFSYSQSPTSMKSVVQAAWLLTVAFGNLLVLVIAKLSLFERQSHELFLFAVLMGIDMVIFAVFAYKYKYVTIRNRDEDVDTQSSKERSNESSGRSNEAYVEETDFNK